MWFQENQKLLYKDKKRGGTVAMLDEMYFSQIAQIYTDTREKQSPL
jgi:hypothetical protein